MVPVPFSFLAHRYLKRASIRVNVIILICIGYFIGEGPKNNGLTEKATTMASLATNHVHLTSGTLQPNCHPFCFSWNPLLTQFNVFSTAFSDPQAGAILQGYLRGFLSCCQSQRLDLAGEEEERSLD